MRKAEKLFQLTNLIRAKQPITADEISQELGVSIRTVYRYIDDLSVSGIPIYGTTGLGYKLDEQFELPPLNLTANELEALILGVKMVCGWTSESFSHSAQSLSSKIEAAIPLNLLEKHQASLHVPKVTDRIAVQKNWELAHLAIKEKVALLIEYQSLANVCSSRVIYPLGLFFWGGKWTVGSWCTLRSDYRDFRLDRIINIQQQGMYTQTKEINFTSYMASQIINKK